MTYDESSKINELISNASNILVIQADNPDGDSLGSALAMEQILDKLGKVPYLYCGMDIPTYLHHMQGWDRVEKEINQKFDLCIIVDTSSISLLNSLTKLSRFNEITKIPCIVLDHHNVETTINFATVVCNKKAVSTGEVIYEISKDLNWELNVFAKERIANSILSDSLGLTTEETSARSIFIIGELVESGVSIPKLDDARRNLMRKSPDLVKYKGELLQRLEYFDDNRIVVIVIPWEEIEKFSHAYNPSMLVIDDMRLVEGSDVAIAFKKYNDRKVTAKIRCNYNAPIALELAKIFGGGGHQYAGGFKIYLEDNNTFDEAKKECVEQASKLLNKLK